jgi:Flp pilus assembly protein TadG
LQAVFFREFKRNDRGASAVEFAFVAPMVIVLIIATIEVGVLEVMSSNLDAAVMSTARKIRTGASDKPTSSAEFRDQVCGGMIDNPADCRSRLAVSVQTVSNFAGAQSTADANPTGQFDAGLPGEIVLIRATYRWPLILPMYAGNFRLSGPSEALLDTRAAFRNEPYL